MAGYFFENAKIKGYKIFMSYNPIFFNRPIFQRFLIFSRALQAF